MNPLLLFFLAACVIGFLYAYATAQDDPYEPHYSSLSAAPDTPSASDLQAETETAPAVPGKCAVSEDLPSFPTVSG